MVLLLALDFCNFCSGMPLLLELSWLLPVKFNFTWPDAACPEKHARPPAVSQ